MNEKQREVIDSARAFHELFYGNVGTTADWPISIRMDEDVAGSVLYALSRLQAALKANDLAGSTK